MKKILNNSYKILVLGPNKFIILIGILDRLLLPLLKIVMAIIICVVKYHYAGKIYIRQFKVYERK